MPTETTTDPDIHRAARMISRRFTAMVSFLLLDEEKLICERQGEKIVREILDELAIFKGK
jgi:hypothetical protein